MPGVKKAMHEFKEGTLHSGSKTGPKVKSKAQAIAIGLNSAGGKKKKAKRKKKPGNSFYNTMTKAGMMD